MLTFNHNPQLTIELANSTRAEQIGRADRHRRLGSGRLADRPRRLGYWGGRIRRRATTTASSGVV